MGSRVRLAVLCLLCLALGISCAVPEGPELLEVHTAGPGLVESGGVLLVSGRGFPAGRSGAVELRGTRLTPGRDPAKVTVLWTGEATSSARLVVNLDASEVSALTGDAPHATFRGSLHLAFSPVQSGAPALRGHLKEVTLDVLHRAPSSAPSDFAAFVGLVLAADLSVVSVAPASEAERVGLRIGDRLHRLDGVRLLTVADFAPRAHGRASLVEYSRPGYSGRAEVLLDRSDYFRPDDAMIWLTLSLGLALLLGLLVAARPPRAAVWLAQTWGHGARGARALRALAASSVPLCARSLAWSLGFVWLLAPGRPARAFDLPLLSGVCLGVLSLAALLSDGRRARGRFSLLAGLGSACWSMLALLPLMLSWALEAITAGSLSLKDLSTLQAGAPLGAGLLASPWTLLAAGAYVLSLVPLGGERSPTGGSNARGGFVVRALDELGLGLALGIWIALYGGGLGRFASPYLAFAFCSATLLGLFSFVSALRIVSGGASRGESWELVTRPLVLISLGTALVRSLLLRFDVGGEWEQRLRWLPLACLLSVAFWLLISALRSLSHHGRRADPWL